MLKLKLDFNIVTAEDRAKFINDFFEANPSHVPSKHELDTITNYMLYGKDPYINKKGKYDPELPKEKWSNMSARKEIEIPTKHATWAKNKPSSLNEIMESPAFNEAELSISPIQTKIPRPSFDRALEKDIPSIDLLWEAIDKCDEKLKDPDISDAEKYKLRHMLVELRRQQFTLKDIFKPILQRSICANHSTHFSDPINSELDWETDSAKNGFAPMGLYYIGDLRFENPLALEYKPDDFKYNKNAENIIDFTNKDHISYLIYFYEEIAAHLKENFMSSQKAILDTLDFYIKNTKLSESQLFILECKKHNMLNKKIVLLVNARFQKTYSVNYISTIYQKICEHIAETAVKIYKEYINRTNPFLYKRCSTCRKTKLRSPDNFMRKTRNSDGFSTKCKECEHKIAKKKK